MTASFQLDFWTETVQVHLSRIDVLYEGRVFDSVPCWIENFGCFFGWKFVILSIRFTVFIIFQIFGWYRYCYNQELCEISEATDCGEIPHEWCSDSVIYQYIQVHFWDNGFLNYWQFKKLPLFALATPTVILCYSSLKKTVLDLTPRVIFADFIGLESAKAGKPWVGPPMQICCAVHLAFLTIFSLFFMNVEVITRLVWSSSPLGKMLNKYYIENNTCHDKWSCISSSIIFDTLQNKENNNSAP